MGSGLAISTLAGKTLGIIGLGRIGSEVVRRARVFEMPISYFPRTHLQGKKISWRDGVAALFHLLRFNCFTPFEQAFKDLPARYHP
jgi:lactate dehydrogenase-like 2-hydroxyacid dehydrogenase